MTFSRLFLRRRFFSTTRARSSAAVLVLRPAQYGSHGGATSGSLDLRPLLAAAAGIMVFNTDGPGGPSRLQERFLKVFKF